jgi:hypothetical protein
MVTDQWIEETIYKVLIIKRSLSEWPDFSVEVPITQTALSLTLGSYARYLPVGEGWFLSCFSFLPYSTGEGNIMLDKKAQCAIEMVSKRVVFEIALQQN